LAHSWSKKYNEIHSLSCITGSQSRYISRYRWYVSTVAYAETFHGGVSFSGIG